MSKIAIYPGTFDPITFGHIDIIQRAAKVCDHLIVAIAGDSPKKTIFSLAERANMVQKQVDILLDPDDVFGCKIVVEPFYGLLVNFAIAKSAAFIIRGLRAVSDFEYEFKMAHMNKKIDDRIETMFLAASEKGHFISSSFVREIAKLGHVDLHTFVPDDVVHRLRRLYSHDLPDSSDR